jgi:hypothetical protein
LTVEERRKQVVERAERQAGGAEQSRAEQYPEIIYLIANLSSLEFSVVFQRIWIQ